MTSRLVTLLLLVLAAAGPVVACSSATGPSLDPTQSNCNVICDQAEQCLNTNGSSCSSNCVTQSNDSESYKNSVAACADCVAGKSCTETASCSGNCLSTLAQQ
jgi:hypothetical protein